VTRRVAFRVEFDLPPGATAAEAGEYIEGEVRAGCGGLDPRDPMFHLDRESVRVAAIPRPAEAEGEPGA
jgi:hypothetical protein